MLFLLTAAVQGRELHSEAVPTRPNDNDAAYSHFEDYPLLNVTVDPSAVAAAKAANEAMPPAWLAPWYYPWDVPSPGPWWNCEEVEGPHAV